ncbi:MAG: adenylosuccinate synthetase [bacterium]|nr:adenylosuccinate synthetase [bacterium]
MLKVIVYAGLVYGDETKGATTHWACQKYNVHTVVRTGGPQALHSVITGNGKEHTFSHFGSGTLAGAATHLSSNMIVDPYAILNEGRALQDLGIDDIFARTTIDENALVITPWQAIANRLKEYARGKNRHGTVGIGVGEAVLDSELFSETAVWAKDIGTPQLIDKLQAIRERKLQELAEIIDRIHELPPEVANEAALLRNGKIVAWAASEFNYMADVIQIVDGSYLGGILQRKGVVVFEPSQGVLLDRWYGFHPYTTKAQPMPSAVDELLKHHGYVGEVECYGITRAYCTRHGAGPFVTEDSGLSDQLPDRHNGTHKWQGRFRVGHLDFVALRYAITACGGSNRLNGLVIGCMDNLRLLEKWQVCDRYRYVGSASSEVLRKFFIMENDLITNIIVNPNSKDQAQLERQQTLGTLLNDCRPVLAEVPRNRLEYLKIIQEKLAVPIKVISFGHTERDRIEVSL